MSQAGESSKLLKSKSSSNFNDLMRAKSELGDNLYKDA